MSDVDAVQYGLDPADPEAITARWMSYESEGECFDPDEHLPMTFRQSKASVRGLLEHYRAWGCRTAVRNIGSELFIEVWPSDAQPTEPRFA